MGVGEGPRERGRIFGPTISDDVARELRAHLEMRTEELIEEGWDPTAAAAEARRLFGNVEGVAGDCRSIANAQLRAERRSGMWDGLWQDVKYGVRTLLRAPEFALIGTLTLGLGIGANTAIFSVVDSVLLEPLPYEDPGEILWVREKNLRGNPMNVAWPNFLDWREQAAGFESLAAFNSSTQTVLGTGTPLTATLATVTEDFWNVFRVRPSVGRLTDPGDHDVGAELVAVVSERFWRNELGGGPLDDRILDLSGTRVRVVGVAADGFDFPDGTDIWSQVAEDEQSMYRSAHNWEVVGRLGPGASVTAAATEMEALTLRIVEGVDDDPDFLAKGAVVMTLHEQTVGGARRALLLLLGAAGMVLLVACTNLASTLLARGETRSRELALRASLGAPRTRIVRQLLTENVLLALAGAASGIGIAALILHGLRALGPTSIPRLDSVGIDGSAVGFAAAGALLTVFVFGLLPARRLSRADAGATLRSGGRGSAGDGRAAVWRILVAGEVALALVLLTGSTLVVRSFQNLLKEDAGFDGSDVAALPMTLSLSKYESPDQHAAWYDRFIREAEALPGVSAAGFTSELPVSGFVPNYRLQLDGDMEKLGVADYVLISGGVFDVLDVPLLRGRTFDERDAPGSAHVAIVSQSFADEYWPGEDPIGKSVTGGGMDEFWDQNIFAEVVGVVDDVRYRTLGREPDPTVYFPFMQRPTRTQWTATLIFEADGVEAAALVAPVRDLLERLDPDVPPRLTLLQDEVQSSVAPQRFTMMLLGGFALLALVLAGAGIYGVVSYQVAQRTREMGIRLALGGAPGSVRSMVVRQSLGVVAVGLAAGLVAVLAGGRLIQALLYGLAPTDPLSVVAAVLVLAGAAFVASWIPAARSTRVDPMITMRAE